MAGSALPVGSVSVEVVADLSKFHQGLKDAKTLGHTMGQEVAKDLTKVEKATDAVTASTESLTTVQGKAKTTAKDTSKATDDLAKSNDNLSKANDNAVNSARRLADQWAKLSQQAQAQERLFQAAEKTRSQFQALAAQGAAQLRSLQTLTAANDNNAKALVAQATAADSLAGAFGRLAPVVALVTAAFGAAQFVSTVTAFQAIESGLKSATGSTEAAGAALVYVRAESERLGLNLRKTASDFMSFAAATKGTELEGQKARDIFTSIAEAGTVLGLSSDNMTAALRALSQMASKGSVASEELKGQLGEVLPGAFNLAAKAAGVTTTEFTKMLEQGQVLASDFLPKFAAELKKAYGPEAAAAALNLQANLNRLQTAITNVFLAVGQGGLTDALNQSVVKLVAFVNSSNSAAVSLGGALATGLRTAGQAFEFLRNNADLAGAAVAALLALRYGPFFIELATSAVKAVTSIAVMDSATQKLAVSQTAAAVSSRALGAALAFVGGPIGLAVTALAAGVAYLALRGNDATKSAEAQATALGTLDAALKQNKGSLASSTEETKKLADAQLNAARAEVEAARTRLTQAQTKAADVSPEVGVAGFEAYSMGADRAAESSYQLGAAQADLDNKTQRLEAVLRLIAGTATDADRALLKLPSTIAAGANSAEAAIPSLQKYSDSLAKLIAMVPELAKAAEAQGKLTQAKTLFDTGVNEANKAYLTNEISQNDRIDKVNQLTSTYEKAKTTVSGYAEAEDKLTTRSRAAAIGAMSAQQAEQARINDAHQAYVDSLSKGEKALLTEAERNKLVAESERIRGQEMANVNAKYAERAAKKAAADNKDDSFDTALQRSKDQVKEFEEQAKAADKASEEVYKLAEANRLRRAAASAGRQDDKDVVEAIEQQSAAYARARMESERTVEAQRKLKETQRQLADEFSQFAEDVFFGGKKIGDAIDGLIKNLASSGLKALLTGQGPLANILGVSGEKGGLGGLLGGKLDLKGVFDFDGIKEAVGLGSKDGVMSGLAPFLEPKRNADGQSMGVFSSPLGQGLASAGVGASIGYSSKNPFVGALGGGLAGLMTGNPIMGLVGAGAGLLGGIFGASEAKKEAKKRMEAQLKAMREAYEEAKPQIDQLQKVLRGEGVGSVDTQIEQAFQQAKSANKTASQGGDQARADQIMKDFVSYAWRLRDRFMDAFEGTLDEVARGFGTSGPFAQAAAAVTALGESLKGFVKDSESLPQAETNAARARAAAQQAALKSLDKVEELSDTQKRLAEIKGTAAGLTRVLVDLGMSATDAAKAIGEKTNQAMEALRKTFSDDLVAKTNDARGLSYLNEVSTLIKERDGLIADAQAIGGSTKQVADYFKAAAQKIVDESGLTGDAFKDLVKKFPALTGQVHEFTEALDSAAAVTAAASRALGYQNRLFAATNDTSTLQGSLAAFDRQAAQQRKEEAANGNKAVVDLEAALAAERRKIISDFNESALRDERTAADERAKVAAEVAGRVAAAEDRIFAVRNDTSTLSGMLAAYDRKAAQERVVEADKGGEAMVSLERAQAEERLQIIRQAVDKENEVRRQALEDAKNFLTGFSKNVKTYLDNLKAGSGTNLSPGDRLKAAQSQFDAQLKLAKAGDRDALSSITQYADNLLSAGQGQFASGKGYQDILASVTKQLGNLPKQVTPEQLVVDALKDQTTILKEVIKAGSASEVAKYLASDFSKLDTNTDGLLSQKEFLKALGPKATLEEQAKALLVFKELDLNGDGLLSKLELVRGDLLTALRDTNPKAVADAFIKNFKEVDVNVDGMLSKKEFLDGLGPLANKEEQQKALKVFNAIDIDGDGMLTKLELLRSSLGSNVTSVDTVAKAVNDNFKRLDTNGSGGLSLKEFKAAFGPLATQADQKIAEAYFKEIDKDGDNVVTQIELASFEIREGLKKNNPTDIAKALKTNFPTIDVDNSGAVSWDEFVKVVKPETPAERAALKKVFDAIDADGDKVVTKAEAVRADLLNQLKLNDPVKMAAALSESFKDLDFNKDDKLSLDEYVKAAGETTMAQRAGLRREFAAMDSDKNGFLTQFEVASYNIVKAVQANNATAFATALNDNFKTLNTTVDGVLDKKELEAAIKGLATVADQEKARAWIEKLDTNNNKQLSPAELAAGRLLDLKGLTTDTTKAVGDAKTAVDNTKNTVATGNTVANDNKTLLTAIKGLASDQKTLLDTLKGYQSTANTTLGEIKSQSLTQKTQLDLLNKQFTLESPVKIPNSTQTLNNGMLSALNKIVFNTGQTVNGLIKLMSTSKPDGLLFAFAKGGRVNGIGTKTSDSNLSWLSNEEFVVNAQSAQGLAGKWLEALNDNPGTLPMVPVPMPATVANDMSPVVAAIMRVVDRMGESDRHNQAGYEMLGRVFRDGSTRVAENVANVADEVAGSREDNRRVIISQTAGRGQPVKVA